MPKFDTTQNAANGHCHHSPKTQAVGEPHSVFWECAHTIGQPLRKAQLGEEGWMTGCPQGAISKVSTRGLARQLNIQILSRNVLDGEVAALVHL